MVLETTALVALVIKNAVDVLKDINSATTEGKSLWQKAKGLFIKDDSDIKDLEAEPENKDNQEAVKSRLIKSLNKPENEALKLELATLLDKLQPNEHEQGNINVVGDDNIAVGYSSGVTIHVNKDKK